ncbi:zinc-binding dehydrogenase [Lichenicoccus sp.]|uniref:zinc-binding dehydrogenase n=1 Tax=Lichenicoccus sp. TaxID=2781899 RepID=UPI003D12AA49
MFGCGQVGQFAIASAILQGAGRVFAVDKYEDRLAMARRQGAFAVNFEAEDPVEIIKSLTGGIGPDRVIDAVGVDAMHAQHGPAAKPGQEEQAGKTWVPGDAPAQSLEWAGAPPGPAPSASSVSIRRPPRRFQPAWQ